MSLESQYADIKSSFEKILSTSEDAISDLKGFAQLGSPSGTYSPKYIAPTGLPIEQIHTADAMVEVVINMANKISEIKYNPPTAVTNFSMLDHKVWKDQFADKLESTLSHYVDTLGIPDKEYQDSIFNESYDRNLQVLNDLYNLADAKVGAKGFTYNNDASTILKLDAQQKYQFDRNQISRDITKLVTEWARQNYQFAIEKGITLEQFHADFTYKYCTAFVDIYKSLILASIEQFKAEIGKYIEPIRALVEAAKLPIELGKVNADIAKANVEVQIQSNQVAVDEAVKTYSTNLSTAVQSFATQVNALSEVAKESASFVQAASRSSITIQK